MQTPGVAQCLKLISVKGCEKIARFAFEYARSEDRSSVACATKANIMKFTEGTLKRVFERVAPDYPEIESLARDRRQLRAPAREAARAVRRDRHDEHERRHPVATCRARSIGGLGFAPSANIGNEVAIFEAVHGSAPKYAGKNVINPTAVILSAVMMLRYLELFEEAGGDRARGAS